MIFWNQLSRQGFGLDGERRGGMGAVRGGQCICWRRWADIQIECIVFRSQCSSTVGICDRKCATRSLQLTIFL